MYGVPSTFHRPRLFGGHLVHLLFFVNAIFKTLRLLHSYYFATKLYIGVPCDRPHKKYVLEFRNLSFEKNETKRFKI